MKNSIVIGAISLAASSAAWAQTCAGNQDFHGAYMFTASRAQFTSSTPVPGEFSASPIGAMLKRASSNVPFAITGKLIADGLGILLAARPTDQYATVRVGSYAVGADCTITATIADGFNTSLNLLGDLVTPGAVQFQGILRDRGADAVFVQTSKGTDTVLHLERPHLAQNCTNSTLSGIYGISATGLDLGSGPEAPTQATAVPFSLLGRFVSDGNGNLYRDTPSLESSQPKRQITGRYTVEADCTGTARLVLDGQTRDINFVIVRGGIALGQFPRAAFAFAFSADRWAGAGTAR